jgi:hypothetical protein
MGQCAFGQEFERFVTDAREGIADTAGYFIGTFLAGLIVIEGHAWQQGDGAVHEADDFHQVYLFGFLVQVVAAALALFAVENFGISQFEEDGFEEFFGDMLFLGYLLDVNRALLKPLGEVNEGMDGIFALF